ncbi:MAG: hypothetical protein ACD_82C00052G0003 [uncultured bacterium]|jgi:predicted RNA-binding protein YlqC (UPF0109 family)|nr:MAG: hypothetical protein ACD_82C00052G0003 [uncultured bacterium]KKP29877.1 MAG: hypothetical protein UR12_C0001G0012 [candidate division TM6 bacterium GW2011_GWF2_30_66]
MPKDIVDYIVKSLVEKPELVSITQKAEGPDNTRVLLEIHVDENDLGKVIGKGGRTIKSIRNIISLIFKDHNLFVDIAK